MGFPIYKKAFFIYDYKKTDFTRKSVLIIPDY